MSEKKFITRKNDSKKKLHRELLIFSHVTSNRNWLNILKSIKIVLIPMVPFEVLVPFRSHCVVFFHFFTQNFII